MSFEAIRELGLKVGGPGAIEAQAVIVGLYERGVPEGASAELNAATSGLLTRVLELNDFKGEPNEVLLLHPQDGPVPRIVLVGLGEKDTLTTERIRQAAAVAVRKCRDSGISRAAACLYGNGSPISAEDAARAFVEGALMGSYQYLEFRTKDLEKIKVLSSLDVVVPDEGIRAAAEPGFRLGKCLADAVNYVRTLASHPGNLATPSFLAAEATRIASEHGLGYRILDRAKMEELGMGALIGVARGSDEPPRFILLEYQCGDPNAQTVAIVGKGLTFDSGGISIKPAAKMEEMKYDMCGGAAILGIMSAVRGAHVNVNVVGAIPSTENLSGGSAYKPGDILRSYSGRTIEVLNCDAEGRLILADALAYVVKNYHPAAIIDLATLTGAVLIALGHYGAGLLGNDDSLISKMESASRRTGERVWRLPIWEEMNDHLKSDFADLKNVADAGAGAGTIVGATFLGNFVEGTPWAHLDIAGTAYWEKDRPYLPKGPSGFGVRLVIELLRSWV